jgi:hypothetical protein
VQFKTAYRLSQEVERSGVTDVLVAGFRRQRFDDDTSWALDLVEPGSGRMVTLDEKDDWPRRLAELKPGMQH